jgi:large subunit ribosomal protein L2
MGIRIYKPTSNGRRNASVIDYKAILTTDKPEKTLCYRIKKSGGRNHHGRTTAGSAAAAHGRFTVRSILSATRTMWPPR